jgi:hypothetical protein
MMSQIQNDVSYTKRSLKYKTMYHILRDVTNTNWCIIYKAMSQIQNDVSYTKWCLKCKMYHIPTKRCIKYETMYHIQSNVSNTKQCIIYKAIHQIRNNVSYSKQCLKYKMMSLYVWDALQCISINRLFWTNRGGLMNKPNTHSCIVKTNVKISLSTVLTQTHK